MEKLKETPAGRDRLDRAASRLRTSVEDIHGRQIPAQGEIDPGAPALAASPDIARESDRRVAFESLDANVDNNGNALADGCYPGRRPRHHVPVDPVWDPPPEACDRDEQRENENKKRKL